MTSFEIRRGMKKRCGFHVRWWDKIVYRLTRHPLSYWWIEDWVDGFCGWVDGWLNWWYGS